MPRATPRAPFSKSREAERAAVRVAAAASVLFALVTAWELFGPLPGGHLGNATGAAIAGENMLRWRVFAAVLDYTNAPPQPASYYAHHPYGVFVLEALAHALFGHHWATVRLPGVLMSWCCPPLVYLTARALWGPLPAAASAVAFALVPINLAFGNFHSLEVITIFFGLLFAWGTARLWQSWSPAYLLPSAVGALGVCQGDWVGLVLVGSVGSFAFLRAYVLPERAFGPVDHEAHARWFALSTAAAVFTLLLYLALFNKAGKLPDLLASADARSSGAGAPLASIFGDRRRMWLFWMLPVPALLAAAALVPLCLARLPRRPELAVALGWAVAACFQYFAFRQGADVHVFWPHHLGLVASLGFGALAHALLAVADRAGLAPLPSALCLAPLALPLALIGRIGLPIAYQSRLTGGRFDDGGRYIAVDQDRSQFSAWVSASAPASATISLHRSFPPNWNAEYGLHRPIASLYAAPTPTGPDDPQRLLVADARFVTPAELRDLAGRFAAEFVGPFLRIDRARPHAPPLARPYLEEQPRGLARYFLTGSDLRRTIGEGEDPWASWEWRHHLESVDQAPPAAQPASPEQARIAHNAAVARGDLGAADALREQALAPFASRPGLSFTGDLHLVGLRVDEGPATDVSLLWETGPRFQPRDLDFLVRSFVTAPPPLWWSAIDFYEKEVAPPTALRPGLWKPSHLYLQRFVAMRRLGTERFEGHWVSRDGAAPQLEPGGGKPVLFTLR